MASQHFELDTQHPQAAAIDAAARALADGGLVLLPADTTYCVVSLARAGSGASAGIRRIVGFKRRPCGPAFPWLVGAKSDLDVYAVGVSDEARMLAEAFWPAGLTIVARASSAVPHMLMREDGTVALRMSSAPVVSGLLNALDRPLVATGANVHGQPAPLAFADVGQGVLDAVDVALEGDGSCAGRATIVDCTHGEAVILRDGVVPRELIEERLGHATPLV
jgi:L-threonylcarbamoyladenylate synthase